MTGNLTGNVTGNVTGNLTGNVTGQTLSSVLDYGTSASSSTSRNGSSIKIAYGTLSINGDSSSSVSNLNFTSSSSYVALCSITDSTDTGIGEDCLTSRGSGSAMTVTNTTGGTKTISWYAIGI